jgi:hypothetical protein
VTACQAARLIAAPPLRDLGGRHNARFQNPHLERHRDRRHQADTACRASRSQSKIRADISASLATSLAGEARLDVGQPDAIRPSVAADRGPMAAPEIRAIHQETANARGAHFGEGDFLGGQGIFDESIQSINRSSSPIALRMRSAMFSFI